MTARLLWSYVTLAVFVLVILEIPLGIAFARNQQAILTAAVERDATVLAGVSEDALERGVQTDLAGAVARYDERTGGRVVIVDADGISVADSAPLAAGRRDFSTRAEFMTALDGRVATGTRFSETLDERLLYVAVPVASGGAVHGAVRITYPTTELDRRVMRNWLLLAAVAAVVLAAATLASFLIARSVSSPLRDLRATAVALADGQLAMRADPDAGPPEVRAVAATFNTMAERLERLIDSQRAFVADASHQLRTPLTALRLRLENVEALVTDEAADELSAAIDETRRLGHLVEGLLVLARTDGTRAELTAVDATDALRTRHDTWQPVAQDHGVALRLDTPPLPAVMALPGVIEQVLDNLLANALDVAPQGSTITMAARQVADVIELHVSDQGPGMSDDARQRAFDRFWSATSGRHDGFGLGLAIVKRLTTASGGDVELRAAPGGGLDAVVSLHAVDHRTRRRDADDQHEQHRDELVAGPRRHGDGEHRRGPDDRVHDGPPPEH